jgi:hypothetical protein
VPQRDAAVLRGHGDEAGGQQQRPARPQRAPDHEQQQGERRLDGDADHGHDFVERHVDES